MEFRTLIPISSLHHLQKFQPHWLTGSPVIDCGIRQPRRKTAFFTIPPKVPINKSFLFLNRSCWFRKYAQPVGSPTSSENLRWIGPGSWEELRDVQTDRQTTDYRNSPPYHGHYACNFYCPIFFIGYSFLIFLSGSNNSLLESGCP